MRVMFNPANIMGKQNALIWSIILGELSVQKPQLQSYCRIKHMQTSTGREWVADSYRIIQALNASTWRAFPQNKSKGKHHVEPAAPKKLITACNRKLHPLSQFQLYKISTDGSLTYSIRFEDLTDCCDESHILCFDLPYILWSSSESPLHSDKAFITSKPVQVTSSNQLQVILPRHQGSCEWFAKQEFQWEKRRRCHRNQSS
jgi:hypothetical protein